MRVTVVCSEEYLSILPANGRIHLFSQSFLADFTGDDRSDGLCVPETGRRTLAIGDAAGTFKVGIFSVFLILIPTM